MQFANYFLASLLSWLGIIAGIILLKIAPEEKKPLAKTFSSVSLISVMLMFFATLFFFYSRIWAVLGVLLLALFFFFSGKLSKNTQLMAVYAMLGFLFSLSSINLNLFVINSCLIFIYGIGKSSELYNPRKKNYSCIVYSAVFLLISNFLFFVK